MEHVVSDIVKMITHAHPAPSPARRRKGTTNQPRNILKPLVGIAKPQDVSILFYH